jgi:hypothetical protein
VEQSLVGLGAAPTDLKATGNSAPGVPSPAVSGAPGGLTPRVHVNRQASPPAFDPTGGKSRTEIAGELVSGAASGVGQAAATALSIDLLRVPAGLLHVAGSAWESGDPVAGLGALFWEPGAAQVDDLVASAIDGDFKGAAEAGVKAITIGVATGVALGELGGAAADAARAVTREDRLEQLAQDPNVSSADRGWIANEQRQVQTGNRDTIRNPPGKDLRHPPGRPAAQGHDYAETQLQDRSTHNTQHRYLQERSTGTTIRKPGTPGKPGPALP